MSTPSSPADIARNPASRRRTPRRDAEEPASRALDRYELAYASEQRFDTLSGGPGTFQILLLELAGATLLLLDEPTDNLDLVSAEALEEGLSAFEGTVLAATHDRWFARVSTGTSCSAPTVRSTNHANRCGTRAASRARRRGSTRPLRQFGAVLRIHGVGGWLV